ncbi:unnamed protein product [Ostreobium quekettii]|uniref:Peptidase M16C associated domain-containing protein n=1 Tax=Ostreobium quekettii TaxID=121088 RepID=A0A8S1J306_9CHLO|nr:unnamed protein product [Ostreobium quekettii]
MPKAAASVASRPLLGAATRPAIKAAPLHRQLSQTPYLGRFTPQHPRSGCRGACRGVFRVVGAAVASPRAGAAVATPPPKEAHGFELVSDEFVKEYDSQVLTYRHKKTGAEVLSLVNDDENKTFSVVFRTPVTASTGIPHILEHSVLCGSRKYPVKEPFVELLKGSLFTFLNAMTAPDRTYYPVASCNLQDYYNLMDIYLDAVFFPRCIKDPLVFQQEGWHHELEKEEDPLTYKGVVFNEMKGVYSSPDQTHGRRVMQVLFPDNNYQHDSGGDPKVIPNLTYKEFQDFHAAYYHPSNSRIWFSGDDPPVERLRILDEYLRKFERREVDSSVTPQALMTAPKRIVERFAAGEKDQKAFVSVNWVLSDSLFDTETQIAFRVLDYLMLGTPAAPLYKALMDSGLGEALIGHGLDTDMKQPFFSVGLKGVATTDGDKVEKVVNDELLRLSKEGFSDSAVQAALNTIEFSLRENNTGNFPRGLALMFAAVNAWIYEKKPTENIKWQEDLAAFKKRLATGENVFGPLITKYLLENPHKVTLEMQPDPQLAGETAEQELERLKKERQAMSKEEISMTVKSTKELKHHQLMPDPPEALKSIPTLKLDDIPKEIKTIPTAEQQESSSTILSHDLFTNDILYLETVLDMRGIPARLLPLVSLYCECVTQMGTEDYSFIELTEQIDGKTGGISVYPFVTDVRGQEEPVAKIIVKAKTTKDKVGDLMDLLQNVLLKGKLDNQQRFKQMVLENKAALESGLVDSGHRFASQRLAAQRSIAGWVSEVTGGLSYLEYVRSLVDRVDSDWPGVQADLEAIRSALLTRNGAIINMTADEDTLGITRPYMSEFLDALPSDAKDKADWSVMLPRVNEAIVVPTQVNYVAKSINLYKDAGYQLEGSSFVIEKSLSRSYLWDRVRVVGGAYGAAGSFDQHSGNFTFWSYRDPNLLGTLDVYDGTVDFLKNLDLDDTALAQAIIGAIGDVDSYQLPDAKGYTALVRHLLNITDAERQERRDQILGTQVKDFHKYAEYLESVKGPEARVVAVTSPDAAKEVSDKMPNFWEVNNVL